MFDASIYVSHSGDGSGKGSAAFGYKEEAFSTGSPPCVLVIEDNETNMRLLTDLLEFRGLKTIQARDAVEGFRLIHELHPDLIVLDIQLPGISGMELTRWIKEDQQLRDIPIVAVTAFAMSGDRERILEAGCDAYVSKPISVSGFLNTIDSMLK